MSVADEVKARIDIVDLIAEQVALQRSGRTFKARCPFHQEKTPSFIVDPDRQTWRCFGQCSEGGDVFSWVMKHEAVEFREALQRLAQRAGVPLSAPDSRQRERDDQRQRLLRANEAALRFWADQLAEPTLGADAREYLTERGVSPEAVQRFALGYAGSEQDALVHYLTARGHRSEALADAGLIVFTDHGPRDRFRERLIFPIRNSRGEVVGFGGRTLAGDPAKYINTPESDLFKKRSLLYGLDLARQHIRERGSVIVVEGYTDVISAHMHGSPNTVASMGTALTDDQVQLLKPLTTDVRFALDADAAGQAATRRGIETVSQQDQMHADIRVIVLPPGRDPDDLIRSEPNTWESLIEQAPPYVDWLIGRARSEHDLETPRGRSNFARELVPIVQAIVDPVLRDDYVRRVAAYARLDAAELLAQRNFSSPTRRRAAQSEPEHAEPQTPQTRSRPRDNTQSFILALALTNNSAAQALDESALTLIDDQQDRQILEALIEHTEIDDSDWITDLPSDDQSRCEELRLAGRRLPPYTETEAVSAVNDALKHIRAHRMREGLRLIGQQLGELEQEYDRSAIALAAHAQIARDGSGSNSDSPELAAAARLALQASDQALRLHRPTPTPEDPQAAAS